VVDRLLVSTLTVAPPAGRATAGRLPDRCDDRHLALL